MVKIEFEKGNAFDTALQARIDAMRELKEKKVLRLTVCKKWFDMIVTGTKKEEYREIKTYWARRLTTNCECFYDVAVELSYGSVIYRPFTHVLFINGYNKDSPRIEKESFQCIVLKSRVQFNNCNHTAFVVHVKKPKPKPNNIKDYAGTYCKKYRHGTSI